MIAPFRRRGVGSRQLPESESVIDLSREMSDLLAAFGAAAPGRGRTVQFVSAAAGEGTSTVAREFARLAAARSARPVWLVDVDLLGETQFQAVSLDPGRFGDLSGPSQASPDGSMFFAVQPPSRAPDGRPWPDARYLSAHAAMDRRLWVTRFRREALLPGQSVRILRATGWWEALRRHADWIVVDSPTTARSSAALALGALMDSTVLVVGAERTEAAAHAGLRDAVTGAGGQVAGMVLNRVKVRAPAFLRALVS